MVELHMDRALFRVLSLTFSYIFLMVGCSPRPVRPPEPTIDPQSIYTAAAQTMQAQLTLAAGQAAVAELTRLAQVLTSTPTPVPPTSTPLPSPTFTSSPAPPSSTLPPTPLPTSTPLPPTLTPTLPAAICDQAQWIGDVTAPDGTSYSPGATFTKIWRVRNLGACTWDASYAFVFVNGTAMTTQTVVPLPYIVRPGEIVDIAVRMVAPRRQGTYLGNWMLRNGNGGFLGSGGAANQPFYLRILVTEPVPVAAYDFIAHYCDASWETGAGLIACPSPSSRNGSVTVIDSPELENSTLANGLVLWARPERRVDGWIVGVFPHYIVSSGDHFRAVIGCLRDSPRCDVTVSFGYRNADGSDYALGSWPEIYDYGLATIDVDLTSYAGRSMQFVLGVTAASYPEQANMVWLSAAIHER